MDLIAVILWIEHCCELNFHSESLWFIYIPLASLVTKMRIGCAEDSTGYDAHLLIRIDSRLFSCASSKQFLNSIFCCNAALRTTMGSPYVCLYVCPSVSFSFFCHLLKKSSGNPYLKICDLKQYFFADAPMKFFFRKFSV